MGIGPKSLAPLFEKKINKHVYMSTRIFMYLVESKSFNKIDNFCNWWIIYWNSAIFQLPFSWCRTSFWPKASSRLTVPKLKCSKFFGASWMSFKQTKHNTSLEILIVNEHCNFKYPQLLWREITFKTK